MKHKNDYSCIAFFENQEPKKWKYVHILNRFFNDFLTKNHPNWKYVNVYERRTGKFLKRYYPNDVVPGFINTFIITVLISAWLALSYKQPLNSTFNNSFKTFNNGFNTSATISKDFTQKI